MSNFAQAFLVVTALRLPIARDKLCAKFGVNSLKYELVKIEMVLPTDQQLIKAIKVSDHLVSVEFQALQIANIRVLVDCFVTMVSVPISICLSN